MSSTTLALALFLGGALLVYAAWTKRSVRKLIVGDNTAGSGGYS